ncbi:MAG TPA: hypothetical protein VLJ60_06050 [bacterium]|nr:hypothetical protein [bacterium]
MKKLFILVAVCIPLFFLSSCTVEDDEGTDNENVVGDENNSKDDSNTKNDSDTIDNKDDSGTEPDNEKTDEGGMYIECTPGETRECYEGPSGSKGIGTCKAGLSTCVVDGTDWSECVGQATPGPEICGDGLDQDCDGSDMTAENAIDIDGDGYTYCDGDCCETSWDCRGEPDKINPGSYEFDDNNLDDNCNGEIDEKTICDEGLALAVNDYPGNAEKLAKGMGVCTGLLSAELSLAGDPVPEMIADEQCGGNDGTSYTKANRESLTMPYYDNKYKTFAVESKFGSAMMPLEGVALSILSTADWDLPTQDAACATLDAGDMKTSSKIPEDWINMMPGCEIPKAPSCGGQAPQSGLTNQCQGKSIPSVQDPIMLTLKLKVPSNARAFEFNLFFMSIEYPTTVCSSENYNDFFIALIDSTYNSKNPDAEFQNPYDKNLAKDELGNPVGVDLAPAGLFKACHPSCGGALSNTNPYGYCEGDQILAGTGFEAKTVMGMCSGSGGTGWLKTTGNVEPNEEITLRLALWEQGSVAYGPDHSWDSTVILDGFKWLPLPGKPGTQEK